MAAPRWWGPDGRRKAYWSLLPVAAGVFWAAAILFGFVVTTAVRLLGWPKQYPRQTRFRRCDICGATVRLSANGAAMVHSTKETVNRCRGACGYPSVGLSHVVRLAPD
jgi:hypothetical protein